MWPALASLLALHTLVHTLWELSKHNPLTCTLDSSFEWDCWASSALHWVASSCGTRWKLWASCELVTLGVYWHLDGLVIEESLSGVGDCLRPRSVACLGSWPSLDEEPKCTLLDCSCHWATSLVGRFLWHYLLARCMIPISPRTTKCWSTQRGLACQQAREPREKNLVSLMWLDFSRWLISFILWLAHSSTWRYNHPTHSFTFLAN